MRLTDFRVRAFRNVVDSRPIPVEPDITCLVGKNESGKTALLEALLRVKPSTARPLDPAEHYPRWLLARDRRLGVVDDAAPVEVRFELDDADRAAVEALAGPGVLQSGVFRFGLRYGGSYAAVELDARQAIANVLNRVGAREPVRAALREAETVEELRDLAVAQRDEAPSRVVAGDEETPAAGRGEFEAVEGEITAMLGEAGSLWEAVVALLDERMPTFVYFDDYAMLPGRVDLEELADTNGPTAAHLETARALLHLAGTDPETLLGDAYELRRAELEAVSNTLTEQVFQFWTQDQDLAVEIDVDTKSVPRGAARTIMTRNLEVRVRDRRRGFTTNFGQRSAGFQWFFSFLAVAAGFDRFPHGVVVLLDEPALTLHPAGQADLLRFIEDRVAPSAQVLYTTHSPFMVNPAEPQRLRLVEDRGPDEGSIVLSTPADAHADTLAPLQTVLGLDLAGKLFGNAASLVVRGPADISYLSVLSDHLARRGRPHLDSRWQLLPAGGASGLPTMLALLGRTPGVTVLLDGRIEQVAGEPLAALSGGLTDRRLVSLADVAGTASATVEDLFADAEYLRLHNGAFGTRLRPEDLTGDGPILDRVAAASGEDVDREAPATLLVRQRRRMLRKLSRDTLDRFEELFEKLNTTLP